MKKKSRYWVSFSTFVKCPFKDMNEEEKIRYVFSASWAEAAESDNPPHQSVVPVEFGLFFLFSFFLMQDSSFSLAVELVTCKIRRPQKKPLACWQRSVSTDVGVCLRRESEGILPRSTWDYPRETWNILLWLNVRNKHPFLRRVPILLTHRSEVAALGAVGPLLNHTSWGAIMEKKKTVGTWRPLTFSIIFFLPSSHLQASSAWCKHVRLWGQSSFSIKPLALFM